MAKRDFDDIIYAELAQESSDNMPPNKTVRFKIPKQKQQHTVEFTVRLNKPNTTAIAPQPKVGNNKIPSKSQKRRLRRKKKKKKAKQLRQVQPHNQGLMHPGHAPHAPQIVINLGHST